MKCACPGEGGQPIWEDLFAHLLCHALYAHNNDTVYLLVDTKMSPNWKQTTQTENHFVQTKQHIFTMGLPSRRVFL